MSEYGVTGSETTVRHHVSSVKRSLGLKISEAFVPLEPSPRGEAEVDWGSATVLLGGVAVRVKIFCMRSKYSGNPFVRLYPCERQQAVPPASPGPGMAYPGVDQPGDPEKDAGGRELPGRKFGPHAGRGETETHSVDWGTRKYITTLCSMPWNEGSGTSPSERMRARKVPLPGD